MKKNIAILFPVSRKMGVFQYALSIAEGLINYCPDFNYTLLYFADESPKEFLKINKSVNIIFISLDASANTFMGKIKFFLNCIMGRSLFTINKKNKERLKKASIDLIVIPFQLLFGFENNIPYIVSIPDVMWNYYPDFPEYSFLKRMKLNFVVHYCTKYSLLNIVDAKSGAEDLKKFYKIAEYKIRSIPYNPPGYVFEYNNMPAEKIESLTEKFNLPEKFIYYPAQFWFHKNHLRLIKALKILKEEKNTKVNLVLAGNPGANNENYNKVMELVKEANMQDQIFQLGYVSDEEVVAMYKKSYALVFPTLIGPTSIPPLEAILLGTPVLCSNLFSMQEQVGDAGLLFDPFDEKDMAEKIYQLWQDPDLRKKLVENGERMAKNITKENFAKKWESAIKEVF